MVDKMIYVSGNQRNHAMGRWVVNISSSYLTWIKLSLFACLQCLTILLTMITDGNSSLFLLEKVISLSNVVYGKL